MNGIFVGRHDYSGVSHYFIHMFFFHLSIVCAFNFFGRGCYTNGQIKTIGFVIVLFLSNSLGKKFEWLTKLHA